MKIYLSKENSRDSNGRIDEQQEREILVQKPNLLIAVALILISNGKEMMEREIPRLCYIKHE